MTDTQTQDPAHRLIDAERDAAQARERLSTTVSQLQARLDPKLLAREAKDAGTALAREAKDAGTAAALAGVEQARRNPAAVAAAAGVAMLLLSIRPIRAALRRRRASRPVPAQPISHSTPPVSGTQA